MFMMNNVTLTFNIPPGSFALKIGSFSFPMDPFTLTSFNKENTNCVCFNHKSYICFQRGDWPFVKTPLFITEEISKFEFSCETYLIVYVFSPSILHDFVD